MNITNRSTIAKYIITALRANNVEPHTTHTAAPGRDWGFVAAYLADDDTYAIQYGDNGATSYDMANDIDDLALWLITDDADTVARCNARDEEPDKVADDYTGACYIITKREMYDSTSYAYEVDRETNQQDRLEFASVAEAQEWINENEAEIYHLAHNESGRPDYFIVAI